MGFAEAGFSALENNRRLQQQIRTKYFRNANTPRKGTLKRWEYIYPSYQSMKTVLFWKNLRANIFSRESLYTCIVCTGLLLVWWLF